MKRRRSTDPNNPEAYLFYQTPIVISTLPDMTRLKKDIYAVIMTQIATNYRETSGPVKEIADVLGSDSKSIRRAISQMIDTGFLIRTTSSKFTKLKPVVPDWLRARSSHLLIGYSDEKGATGLFSEKTEGATGPKKEATGPKKGATGLFSEEYTSINKILDPKSPRAPRSAIPEESETQDLEGTDPNPSEEIDHLEEEEIGVKTDDEGNILTASKKPRPAAKPKPKQRGLVSGRKASGSDKKRNPSERWELLEGAKHPRNSGGWDLLGYWARWYVEIHKKEDPSLFVTDGTKLIGWAKSIQKWVEEWMDGDFNRARRAIDKIITQAKPLGYPVSIMYYFTASKEGPLPALLAGAARRKVTPTEINDAAAADPAYSDSERRAAAKAKRIQKIEERRARQQRRGNGNHS